MAEEGNQLMPRFSRPPDVCHVHMNKNKNDIKKFFEKMTFV